MLPRGPMPSRWSADWQRCSLGVCKFKPTWRVRWGTRRAVTSCPRRKTLRAPSGPRSADKPCTRGPRSPPTTIHHRRRATMRFFRRWRRRLTSRSGLSMWRTTRTVLWHLEVSRRPDPFAGPRREARLRTSRPFAEDDLALDPFGGSRYDKRRRAGRPIAEDDLAPDPFPEPRGEARPRARRPLAEDDRAPVSFRE